MRFYIPLFIVFNALSTSLKAQDFIILYDKTEVPSSVQEITDTHVKYKDVDFMNGPLLNIKRSLVFMILFENGKKIYFNDEQKEPEKTVPKPTPQTTPNPFLQQQDRKSLEQFTLRIQGSTLQSLQYYDFDSGRNITAEWITFSLNGKYDFGNKQNGFGAAGFINISPGVFSVGPFDSFSEFNLGGSSSYSIGFGPKNNFVFSAETGLEYTTVNIDGNSYDNSDLFESNDFHFFYALSVDLFLTKSFGFNLRYESIEDVGLLFGVGFRF